MSKDIGEMTTEEIADMYFKCKKLYDKKKGSSQKTIEDVWGHMLERWFEEQPTMLWYGVPLWLLSPIKAGAMLFFEELKPTPAMIKAGMQGKGG